MVHYSDMQVKSWDAGFPKLMGNSGGEVEHRLDTHIAVATRKINMEPK